MFIMNEQFIAKEEELKLPLLEEEVKVSLRKHSEPEPPKAQSSEEAGLDIENV